jgi:hypothetical protein
MGTPGARSPPSICSAGCAPAGAGARPLARSLAGAHTEPGWGFARGAACGARRAGRGVRGAACGARRARRGVQGAAQSPGDLCKGGRRGCRANGAGGEPGKCVAAGRTRRTRFWAQPWLERSNRVCVLLYIHPRPVGGGRGRRPSSSAGCRSRKWAGAPCWRPRRAPDISSSMRGAYLTPRRTGGARRRAARARETAEGGRSRAKPKQAKMPRRPLLVTPALCARQQAQVARGAGATSIDEGGRRGPRVI